MEDLDLSFCAMLMGVFFVWQDFNFDIYQLSFGYAEGFVCGRNETVEVD
jgi:hypothetical protein